MKSHSTAEVSVRLRFAVSVVILATLAFAGQAAAQVIPYWDNGNGSAINFDPAPWPSTPQWIAYTRTNDSINDQRTQDPSNGGTSPQAYVNVSSGCTDQALPSVYYYYDAARQVIFYRWRVENAPNNYATGPAPGAFSSTNPWQSAQWTVLFDTNGDGFRDFAAHLNGSTGSPSAPIDMMNAIWSPTLSNTLDYLGDPANVHLISSNPTAFIQGTSGNTNNQILQFNGSAVPTVVQWPNGSSETVWDYGTTRATDVSTSTCREYFVDYQIPLGMLDATAFGGPALTPDTPFSFMFATANSLQNPFQKDIVLNGDYTCNATAPAPFGDPLTLSGGIIEHPIATSVAVGSGSCASVPLSAQILDTLEVEECETVSTLSSATKFVYYYDINGDGLDNDGGVWTDVAAPATRDGTIVRANWDTSSLVQGQYLIAVELIDTATPVPHTTRTWLSSATPPIYTNFPTAGISPATLGVNYAKTIIAGACGALPPSMTKVASTANVQAGGAMSYTLTITNNAATPITLSTITDTLPAGFAYVSNDPGNPITPSSSPAPGATGTISWTFPGGTTVPGSGSQTFSFNVTAGSTPGSFFNTATAVTSAGTVSAADNTGITVQTAAMAVSKIAAFSSAPTTPITTVDRNAAFQYTVNYSNISDTITNGVVVTDTLPSGVTFVSAVPVPTSVAGSVLTWNIGNVAANSGPFTITINVTATTPGSQTNYVELTSTNAATESATATVLVSGPALTITKTATASAVSPPATVDYTITYSNVGDAAASITTVTDTVPAGFLLVTGAPTTAGCTQAGGIGTQVTCTVNASLAAGASQTRTLRFSVTTAAPDPSVNTATVNASNAASASANYSLGIFNNSCGTSTILGVPNVTGTAYFFDNVQTDVTTGTAEQVGYTRMTAIGAGYGVGTTVTFSAPPAGTTATGTAVINGGRVVGITLTNPGSGYTTAPTVTITGGGGAGATAQAFLTSTQYTTAFPTPAGAATTTPLTIVPTTPIELARFYSPVLSATDAMAITNINDGLAVVQLYIDKNGAPQVQARVTLYDFDPATLTSTQIGQGFSTIVNGNKNNEPHAVLNLNIAAGTVLPAGHRLLWTIEYISNNQENDITLRWDGAASPSLARICAAPIRPSITKTVDKATAIPGVDQLVYTITYSNPGGGAIPNVVISDPLPAGLTYVSASPAPTSAPAVGANGTVTWSLGTLAAGASGTLTLTVNTTNGMTASSVTNTATLTNNVTAPVSASATTQLRKPAVSISKRVNDAALAPGDTFAYTIDVVNAGNAPASSVVVTDFLPSFITSTNYTGTTNTVATVTMTAPGSGYTSTPTVSFSGGGGTGAAGTAIVSGNTVVGISITSGGTGYTSAPAILISGGGGAGATATATLAGVTVAGSTITFNVGSLAVGATATFVINAQVATSGIPAGDTTLTNTAQVVDSYNTTPRTSTADVIVSAAPVLTLTETATPSANRVVYVNVTAGGTYTDIPTVSFTGGGCTGVTGTVSVTGTPGNYTVTGVTITNPGSGCTSNPTVVFTGAGPGGATATPTVGPAPGDTITYVLTATNIGNATATGVVLFDEIPNYTNYLSGGTFSIDTVYSTATNVAPGASTQLTYTVTVGASLPKGQTSLVTNGGLTSTNTPPPAPVTTTVLTGAAPAYSIDKSPDDQLKPFPVATLTANAVATTTVTVASTRLVETGSYVVIGTTAAQVVSKTTTTITLDTAVTATSGTNVLQAIEYVLSYENDGNATGTNVVVSDVLPAGLAYGGIPTGATAPNSAPAIGASGTITWNIGTLVNGDSGIRRFLAYATIAGTYTNTATISDGNTLNTYNDSDSATATFGALDPQKTTSTPSIINQVPTNVATYTITVNNPLATPATSVHVIDNLSTGFTYRPGSTIINGVPSADPTSEYVAGIALTNGGSGYTSAPTVTISGGGGTGATAKATISGGVVTGIIITNPGSGFTSAPTVSFSGGAGAGAAATAFLSDNTTSPQWAGLTIPGGGTLTITFSADLASTVPPGLYQNEVLTYGSIPALYFDYLGTTQEDVQVCVPPPIVSAPPACGSSAGNVASILNQPGSTVTWSITNGNGTITTASTGTIHQVALGSGGSGYSIAPAVSFTGGGGTGAAAIATVSGGVITAITITNPGSGYTSVPTVVITPNGSGSGATAAAVLGTGIIYTAGASGTVNLQVTVTREFSNDIPACNVVSNESVAIDPSPAITVAPGDITVCPNTLATFTVTATNATAYQWQVSTNGGGIWNNVVGATASTYAFTATLAENGNLYRVIASRGPSCTITSAPALLTVSCGPDLAVILNADTPDPVIAGENITYNQQVRNISPTAATAPSFTQTTPAGTTFVSMTPPAGWSCTTPAVGATGAITCTADANTLAANTTTGNFVLVLATSGTLAHGATIALPASVSMQEVDPSPSNNTLTANTGVIRRVDNAVVKTNSSNAPPYGPGYLYSPPSQPVPLHWTIVVTNNGPSRAENTTVTDTLPAEFVYDHTNAPATSTQGSCAYNSGTRVLTCTIGTLNNGDTATITVPGFVDGAYDDFSNTATVTQTETDRDLSNNSSTSNIILLAPTAIEMLELDAVQTPKGVTVLWQTSLETDNIGFNVYRSAAGGPMEQVNEHLIHGSALVKGRGHNGRNYRFKDIKVPAGFVQYYVEDIDIHGVTTMHGPVTPRIGEDDEAAGSPTDPDPGIGSTGGVIETGKGMGVPFAEKTMPVDQRMNQQWHIVSGATSAKLVVAQTGWVRVTKQQLVAAGWDPGTNSKAISVFVDGMEIPVEIRQANPNRFDANDTIEFFGSGMDTATSGARIYFVTLGKGKGLRLKSNSGAKKGSAAPASFRYTYSRKTRTVFFSSLTNNGDRDNFFGAIVNTKVSTDSVYVENLDPAGAPAELEIVLQGGMEKWNHVVSVKLNGNELGPVRFYGLDRHVFKTTVPLTMLVAGKNTLTFKATNTSNDISVVEAVSINYPHLYRADNDALAFTAPSGSEVVVGGLTTDAVSAVDVTDALDPIRLEVKTVAGNATVVVPDGQQRTVLVYADSRVSAPGQVVLNQASTWNDAKNRANLVIITNRAFLDQATTLKAAREGAGIATAVVDVQNLYDEFSFGHHGPQPMRDFLKRAQGWALAPKYAILLGDASFDPRNYLGTGNFDFVPTKLIATDWMKTSSDDWFADFDDTGIPAMAIGRIPVRTAAHAANVVNKLVQRGVAPPSATWTSTISLVTDRPDKNAPFDKSSAYLQQAVPSSMTIAPVDYRNFPSNAATATAVKNAFNNGSLVMNYVGHGSVENWSRNAMTSAIVPTLTNGTKLPFVMSMNCLNGYFHDLYSNSLGEVLLRHATGGAIGVWASSATTSADQQTLMNAEALRQIFAGATIGEAVLKAKAATTDKDVRRTFILMGDPTMRLK